MAKQGKSREERLAAALRENLRRRKAQSRKNSSNGTERSREDDSSEQEVPGRS